MWYRIRIGLDYTLKILDWIRIAKIFDPFNTNPNPKKSEYPSGLDSKNRILYTTGMGHDEKLM